MKRGNALIFTMVIIGFLLTIAVITGIFIFKNNTSKELLSSTPTQSSQTINTNTDELTSNLTKFFEATKSKNMNLAKSFLSKTPVEIAFAGINNPNNGSVYTKNFSYKITQSKIDENKISASVEANITLSSKSLAMKYFFVKESGAWKIADAWSEMPPDQVDNVFKTASSQTNVNPKMAVIRIIDGPAHFSLYSPIYGSLGFETGNKEIKDLGAVYFQEAVPEFLSITDLSGAWIMKVKGQGSGEIKLQTEIIDNTNYQIKELKDKIKSGENRYYLIVYPETKGQPISITPLS